MRWTVLFALALCACGRSTQAWPTAGPRIDEDEETQAADRAGRETRYDDPTIIQDPCQRRLDTKIVNLDTRGNDVREILAGLAAAADIRIVMDDAAQGPVNLDMSGVTLREALRNIVEVTGLVMETDGCTLRIRPPK